jgi:hypothetical protein
MGFFQTIKNKLGIGGVSFTIEIPGQVSADDQKIDGKLLLTTKSDQKVLNIKLKVYEKYTSGRGDKKTVKTFDLGKQEIEGNFEIKTGESKTIDFSIPFKVAKSSHQELSEKGGALGALGKLASMATDEKFAYFVEADVDVENVALDPSEKKEFRVV